MQFNIRSGVAVALRKYISSHGAVPTLAHAGFIVRQVDPALEAENKERNLIVPGTM